MTEDELAAIEARANAATPGPWSEITTNSEERKYIWARGYWLATMHDAWFPMAPNAEFIAHAREDVPALVAEVRRLQTVMRKAADEFGSEERRIVAVYRADPSNRLP